MSDIITESLEAEAEALGLDYRWETGGKHRRFYFRDGKKAERFVSCAVTPSDSRRAGRNAVRDLRKEVGRRSRTEKSPRRGERRDVCKREVITLDKITCKPDPFEGLGEFRDQLRADQERDERMRRRHRRAK